MLFGLPLPVCSCGVLPLYHSLVRRGVPSAAAFSFLVATPELGLGAIILSLPLLGAPFTGVRVVAAALIAIVVGLILSSVAQGTSQEEQVVRAGHQRSVARCGVRALWTCSMRPDRGLSLVSPWPR